MLALSNFLRWRRPVLAMVHTPIDPSEAWRWKVDGETVQLWNYAGYQNIISHRTPPNPHEFTFLPFPDKLAVVKGVLEALRRY
jgi:hypothetical protein